MTTLTSMHILETAEADIAYDVNGPLPTGDGRPPLLMIGRPMDASGFRTSASHSPDRTVVTYDPRGLGRSTRKDGRIPVPADAAAAERAGAGVRDAYGAKGRGAGMAAFIAMTSWRGELSFGQDARNAATTAASSGKTKSSRSAETITSSDTSAEGLKASRSTRLTGGTVANTSNVPSSPEQTLSSRMDAGSTRAPVSSSSSRAAASCQFSPCSM